VEVKDRTQKGTRSQNVDIVPDIGTDSEKLVIVLAEKPIIV
jgi:hypothetical protein